MENLFSMKAQDCQVSANFPDEIDGDMQTIVEPIDTIEYEVEFQAGY